MQITATFHRYFVIRFLKYLLAINLFFVLLFNFIEFFEKLSRAKNSSVHEILYFLALNIAPTFFEQLPISSWLTSCLLIREFYLQQELDALVLLGFSLRKFLKLFIVAGTGLALTSFVINECFVTSLTFKAEQYKMEHFKQISTRTLVNKWFALEQEGGTLDTFCYFSVLNSQKSGGDVQEGKDLFLIYTTPQGHRPGGRCPDGRRPFTLQKTISAPSFSIDTKKQQILLPEGKIFDVERNIQTKITHYVLTSPSFFSQINLHYETPTVINLIKGLMRGHNIIPAAVSNDLLGQLLKRLILYLLLILYPVFTFGLFGLFWRHTLRWLVIFAPFPLLTITSFLTDQLLHHGINAWLAFTPYSLWIIGLWVLYWLFKQL